MLGVPASGAHEAAAPAADEPEFFKEKSEGYG